jgi:glycosyltransferase involved in cell wall biosynthesis
MTNARPRLGVGVPVFNGERFLAETLDSLLAQTYEDFVLIIGDNASTDRTEEIARAYAARDPRIEYVRHPGNIGAARNYNDLFYRAGTEYFRWHAADDISLPEYTARCLDVLDADPGVILAYCKTMNIDQDGHELGPYEDKVDAQQEHARDRFLHVVKVLERCNAVYGVIRSALAARTKLMETFVASDRCFMAELTLYGRIIEVPDRFFLRRYHTGASSAMTDEERRTFFSAQPAAPTLQTLRHLWAYWTAVLRAPLSVGETVRLQVDMLKFAYWGKANVLREAAKVLRYHLRIGQVG